MAGNSQDPWNSGWRRIAYKPDESGDGYMLHANGALKALGNAPPGLDPNPTWSGPAWPFGGPICAFQIIDWTTPSGWLLDYYGRIHGFGALDGESDAYVGAGGIPQCVDFIMDPNGSHEGWALDVNGGIHEFGGAQDIVGVSIPFEARRLYGSNDHPGPPIGPGKLWLLGARGQIFSHHIPGNTAPVPTSWQVFAANNKAMKALALHSDWYNRTAEQGWSVDYYGHRWPISGDEPSDGWIGTATTGIRDCVVFSEDPLEFRALGSNGVIYAWRVSSPPTATPGSAYGPADPTTTTTRPVLTFLYEDQDGDTIDSARMALYRSDNIGHLVDEVQTWAWDSAPSTGFWKMSFEGHDFTVSMVPAQTASGLQARIRADWPGCGGVTVTGPNGGPYTVTFTGGTRSQCAQIVPRIIDNTTGKTMTITRTTPGTDFAEDTSAARRGYWEIDGFGAVVPEFDLEGGPDDGGDVVWRIIVDATDSSGLRSGQQFYEWTQSVDRPDAPTITLDDRGGLNGIAVGVTLNNPPANGWLDVQYSDDYNPAFPNDATWEHISSTYVLPGGIPTIGELGQKGDYVGVNSWPLEDGGGISGDTVDKLADLGARGPIRFTQEWDWLETSEGVYDWSSFDAELARARAGGHAVWTSILGCPTWINPHSGNSYSEGDGAAAGHAIPATNKWLPTDATGRAKAAQFAVLLASRLDPTTDYFEIWNEPNIEQFNAGLYQTPGATSIAHPERGPWYQDATDWALLMEAVIPALRAFFPTLKIVAGGLASVGDLNAPQSASNRIDLSPGAFLATAVAAVPSILTTAAPEFWNVHTYNFSGGALAYPDSLPNTTKGWGGHYQADAFRVTLQYLGIANPKILVSETGAPGALPTSSPINYGEDDSMVAAGYTEDFQALYHAVDQVEIWKRVLDGRYSLPITFHTTNERTASSGVERFYGVYRSGPASTFDARKPAATILANVFAEYLSVTGDGDPSGIVDLEAPFGRPRYYRARVYTISPWLSSPWTEVQAATLSDGMWAITIPGNPLAQLRARVVPGLDLSFGVSGHVAQPVGASLPVSITDGGTKGVKGSIQIDTLTDADTRMLSLMLQWDGPLLLRNPFGDAWYVSIVEGEPRRELLRAANPSSEPSQYLTRHAYRWNINVSQVRRAAVITTDILATTLI